MAQATTVRTRLAANKYTVAGSGVGVGYLRARIYCVRVLFCIASARGMRRTPLF